MRRIPPRKGIPDPRKVFRVFNERRRASALKLCETFVPTRVSTRRESQGPQKFFEFSIEENNGNLLSLCEILVSAGILLLKRKSQGLQNFCEFSVNELARGFSIIRGVSMFARVLPPQESPRTLRRLSSLQSARAFERLLSL